MLPVTTHRRMLEALQDDVNVWPRRVKEAGVKNAAGSAYVPHSRNNEILRTPDDPAATYAYMLRAWEDGSWEDGSADGGPPRWHRIIEQAGTTLLWEWLMIDPAKPYAALFPAAHRERIRSALEGHSGNAVYTQRNEDKERAAQVAADRLTRMQDEMRSGTRNRPNLSELDRTLWRRRPSLDERARTVS